MSSYTYKNILIVERGTTNEVVIALVKTTYNIWFDVSTADCLYDKIILFYDPSAPTTSSNDTFTEIDSQWKPPNLTPVGFMHVMSCDKFSIKVTKCRFPKHEDFAQEMRTFWQYIAESLRARGMANIDAYGVFTIYWDKDTVAPYANMVREVGLMTNFVDYSHTFRDIEIRIASASALPKNVLASICPTAPTTNMFGPPATAPTTSMFGPPATTPPTTSMFGPPATTPPTTSMFGPPATTPNMFGPPATTAPNMFGQRTTAPNMFGQGTTAPNMFGQGTTAPTTTGFGFGTSPATTTGFGCTSSMFPACNGFARPTPAATNFMFRK